MTTLRKLRSFRAAAAHILKRTLVEASGVVAFGVTTGIGSLAGAVLDYAVTIPMNGFPDPLYLPPVPTAYFLNDKFVIALNKVTLSVKDASMVITNPNIQANLPPSWQVLTLALCMAGGFLIGAAIAIYPEGTVTMARNFAHRKLFGEKVKSIGPKF